MTTNTFPTFSEALIHLGYEPADASDTVVAAEVNRVLAAAIATLKGAVGADVETLMPNDGRVTELVVMYMDDLHSTRGISAKVSNATRHLTHTMELQLTLELRALREAAARNGGDQS